MNRKRLFLIIVGIVLLGLIFLIRNFPQKQAFEKSRCEKFEPYYTGSYNTKACISAGCKTKYQGDWSCVPKFPYDDIDW